MTLARDRMEPFGERAEMRRPEGAPSIDADDARFDRFVSGYLPDLLSPADVQTVLREAPRLLAPGGLLCAAGLPRVEAPPRAS